MMLISPMAMAMAKIKLFLDQQKPYSKESWHN